MKRSTLIPALAFAMMATVPQAVAEVAEADPLGSVRRYIETSYVLVDGVYIFPEENDLFDLVEAMQPQIDAYRRATGQDRQRAASIEKVRGIMEELQARQGRLSSALEQGGGDEAAIGAQLKRIEDELDQLQQLTIAARVKIGTDTEQLAAAVAPKLAEAWQLADELQDQYNRQMRDDVLLANIEVINEFGDEKVSLGPSQRFRDTFNRLKALRGDLFTGTLTAELKDGELWLNVRLNGGDPRAMRIEPYSELTLIPAAWAESLGIEQEDIGPVIPVERTDRIKRRREYDSWGYNPGFDAEEDPEVRFTVRVATSELVSVSVGRFYLMDVEMGVIEPDQVDQTPVLGASFFDQFNFRIDPETGVIRLSPSRGDRSFYNPGGGFGMFRSADAGCFGSPRAGFTSQLAFAARSGIMLRPFRVYIAWGPRGRFANLLSTLGVLTS